MTTSEARATGRLYLLTAAIGSATALLWFAYAQDRSITDAPFDMPLWGLIAAFAATELLTVHIEARGEAHALTFSEIPTIAGLLLADPQTVLVARVVSGVVILGLVRRQSLHKLTFNVALFSMEAVVAASVLFALLRGHSPVAVEGWPAVFDRAARCHFALDDRRHHCDQRLQRLAGRPDGPAGVGVWPSVLRR